jgi:RHS repeat-associated protein
MRMQSLLSGIRFMNRRAGMKKSISFKVALSVALSLYMVLGPCLLPLRASGRGARKPVAQTLPASLNRANTNAASAGVVRFLRVPPPQTETLKLGQSTTLMPDGRWLLLGGRGADGPLRDAQVKDARGNSVQSLANGLQQARASHSATLLPDGTVLVFGGVGANGEVLDSAELFHPDTQQFELLTLKGLTARAYHTATLLTDGQVLIAGGTSAKGEMAARVELWNPRTKTVRVVPGQMQSVRSRHSATLQPDGAVLLWGGVNSDGTDLDDGVLYEPKSEQLSWIGGFTKFEDENAPYLRASLPEDGTTDVPVETQIALRFSKPLSMTTVNPQTVSLKGSQGTVEAKITPAEGGMLAFILPQEKLSEETTYTITLAEALDESGRALTYTMLSFTTVRSKASGQRVNDGEDWIPDTRNMRGDWRSNRPESQWQKMPPLEAAPGVTALAGQVLLLNGNPLPDVTLHIGARSTRTDNTGRFLLADIPAGHHVMRMDGQTASKPQKTYGVFKIGVDVEAGKTNVLPFTSWMPRLDTEHVTTLSVPTSNEVAVTTPYIPGLEVRVPQGAVVRNMDGQTVTQLSITPIPVDRTPFPLPGGVNVPVFFTVQPGASRVIPPRARVVYPNYGGDRPGTRMNFWNYDPEGKGWYIYGQGTVTADGRQVIPDPGVVIYEFTGFMINRNGMPPPPGSGPDAGSDATGGDPVDLATGLFIHENVDLAVIDTMPLALKRTYRQNDSASRGFGIGASLPYDLYLYSAQEYVEADLILPNGGRVHYVRISSGTGFTDAEFEHSGSDSAFYKSRLKWNGNGWNLTLKNGLTYVFGDEAPLHTIKDRHGNKVTISRANTNGFGSPSGNITKITSSNGRWIAFTYDTTNRITQAKDNIGRTVNYTYDAGGRLWKVTDPQGGVTEYTYDSAHRMLTIKDPKNVVWLTNLYDANGRVVKQTQADGTTYQFAYTLDTGGKVTQTDLTDTRGNIRRVTFNANGHTLTDTFALGKPEQQKFIYERQANTNLVASITDQLNRKTTYTYDPKGNVTEITRLAGTAEAVTTRLTYEPAYNFVASVTDPLNHTVTFTYDAKGNIVSMRNALNQETTFTYNAAGQLLSASDALNNTAQFRYEGGDLVEVIDPKGNSTSQFLDDAGRLLSLITADGRRIRYEYDAMNRPVKTIDPQGNASTFGYDANGNLTSLTNARGDVTTYTYNNMDRLVTRKDPLLRSETYVYDAAGNLTKVTDRRGTVTTFAYDSLNRKTFIGYGTVASQKSTTYESTVNYTLDTGSRLTKMVDSLSGTVNFTYDQLNRLTSKSAPQGTINYAFDAANRQTSMTVVGQPAVNYTYDDANRLTGIVQGSSSVGFGYDSANRRTSLSLPNGVLVEYSYDRNSRLSGITYKKGTSVIGDLSYERDRLGNRTQMGGSLARVAMPQAVAASTYNAGSQLTQRDSSTFTYDANGNLTSDGVNTYTWNARNQLASISGGTTASFQYDPFGRRVKKTVNGVATDYLHDGHNTVQELVGGTPNVNYLVGATDEVFTRKQGTNTETYLVDGLGSTLALLDAAGSVQTEYTYDPFGKTAATGAATNNSAQFTGRENDGTGLYFYRSRYYSPSLQRFISEDPIGFGGGINMYAYVGNNPLNWIDPLGLDRGNPLLDGLQTLLDIGGMIPGLGEPLDLINAGISGLRGDYGGAALSMAGAVPFAGNLATAGKLARRAEQLHDALDPIAQSRRTTAVVEAVDASGNVTHIVASSENSLSAAQRAALGPGEVAARGPGHAEVTALNAAQQMGLTPVNVAASRPICANCAQAINNAGATPVTPLK